MAKKITRGITGIKDITKQDFDTKIGRAHV